MLRSSDERQTCTLCCYSAARTTLLPVYAPTTSRGPVARNTPVPIPCPMVVETQVRVSIVHYERLLHVLRLLVWR